MDKDTCPTSKNGRHWFQPFQNKAEFEPQTYGDNSTDTLYKRVEYIIATCACSASRKTKIFINND